MSNAYLQAVAPVKLQSTRKFVLFVLADMARDDGTSYASIAAICERTCLTDRAVQLCLTELENAGFLLREYRHGRSTFYRLQDPASWPQTPKQNSPPNDVRPRTSFTNGGEPDSGEGEPDSGEGEPHSPISITKASLNPKSEPKKKTRASKPRAAVVIPIAPDWLNSKAWAEWAEYRSKLKGYTTRALELSLKTIDKHRRDGHDPVRLIECAIERGWTGIYPSDATLADGQQLGSATGRALVALQRMKGTGNVTQDFDAAWAQQPRLPAGMLPRDPRSEEEQLEAMIAGSLDPEATRALLHAESTEESQA